MPNTFFPRSFGRSAPNLLGTQWLSIETPMSRYSGLRAFSLVWVLFKWSSDWCHSHISPTMIREIQSDRDRERAQARARKSQRSRLRKVTEVTQVTFNRGSESGNSDDASFVFEKSIGLKPGKNKFDLLSMTVGLQNFGPFFDIWGAGIIGPVRLKGFKNTTKDLSMQQWTYQIGLKGEQLGLYTGNDKTNEQWTSGSHLPRNETMVWYKTQFEAPDGNDPVALNLASMGKGQAWINGESIGRYWPAFLSPSTGCNTSCDYRGLYDQYKCLRNCGQPSQNLYHVPRSWIRPTGNVLVLFEEIGGDPSRITFLTRSVETVCAQILESYPPPVKSWESRLTNGSQPELQLNCDPGYFITSIKFASFGTPEGQCGSLQHGKCRARNTLQIVEEACIGRESCTISISTGILGDPCPGVDKRLAVEATCS